MRKRFKVEDVKLTKYLFFTGKGGDGKTSTACATAMSLADDGKRGILIYGKNKYDKETKSSIYMCS